MYERLQHVLQQYLGTEWSIHLVNATLFFVAVLVLGVLLRRFLNTAGRRLIASTETELDDRILEVILPRVKWLTIVIGAYLFSDEIAKAIPPTDRTGLQLHGYANGLIYVAFVTLISILLIRLTDVSIRYGMERHAHRTASKLNEAILPLLHRVILIVIVLIASITALGHFGVDVSSLLVFLGGSSVAVALAAQDTLQNMIAGFVIMLDRPFRVGDRIKLPTNEVGDVYEIGLRSTKVLDFDNNLIVSPNAELVKSKIINFSYPRHEIRVLVETAVAYGTDLDRARSIMLDFARANSDLLGTPAPEVFLAALDESAVQLQLVGRTDDWSKKWRAETTLREQIYNAFLANGIQPGLPQRVVQVVSRSDNAASANASH